MFQSAHRQLHRAGIDGVPVGWDAQALDAVIRRMSNDLDDPDHAFDLLMQVEPIYLHLLQREREKRSKK